jgi:hypothetical protein
VGRVAQIERYNVNSFCGDYGNPFAFFDMPVSFSFNEEILRDKYFQCCSTYRNDKNKLALTHKYYRLLQNLVKRLDIIIFLSKPSESEFFERNIPIREKNPRDKTRSAEAESAQMYMSIQAPDRRTDNLSALWSIPNASLQNQSVLTDDVFRLYEELSNLSIELCDGFILKIIKLENASKETIQKLFEQKDFTSLHKWRSKLVYYEKFLSEAYKIKEIST